MSSVPHRIKKTVNHSSIFTTFLTMCVLWSFKSSARAFHKTKIKHVPCPTTATANWIQPVREAASAKITAIVWRRVRFCDSGPFESVIDFFATLFFGLLRPFLNLLAGFLNSTTTRWARTRQQGAWWNWLTNYFAQPKVSLYVTLLCQQMSPTFSVYEECCSVFARLTCLTSDHIA